MLANSNAVPRTIQLALGSYSVTATYTGSKTFGEAGVQAQRISIQPSAPAAPVLSPAPGKYKLPQLVSIFSAAPDALLYYAVNQGSPTRYTGPFPLRGSDTIEAVAIVEVDGRYLESPVAIAAYHAEAPPPEPPIVSPAGGTFPAPQTVTIKPAAAGVTLYYSVNREMAQRYSGPITIATDAIVEAVAIGNFGSLFAESAVVIASFKILP